MRRKSPTLKTCVKDHQGRLALLGRVVEEAPAGRMINTILPLESNGIKGETDMSYLPKISRVTAQRRHWRIQSTKAP
jgi:hypothetical protein